MRLSTVLLALIFGLFFLGSPAGADEPTAGSAPAAPPPQFENLSRDQVRDVMARMSDSQVRDLLLDQFAKSAAPQTNPPPMAGGMGMVASEAQTIRYRLGAMISAADDLPHATLFVIDRLTQDRDPAFIGRLAVAIALIFGAAALAEVLFRRLVGTRALALPVEGPLGDFRKLGLLAIAALVDVFALAAFAIVGVLVYFLLHPADDFLRIAFWQIFLSVLIARLVVTAAGLILAPLRPDLRLPSITSATARVLFHRLIFLTALLAIGHTIFVLFQFAGVPEPLVLLTGTIVQWIVVIVLVAFIWLERHAIAQLLGLHAGSPGAYPTEARLGRIGAFFAGTWHVFVSAVFIGMGLFATTSRLLTAESQGPRIIATLLLVAALPAVDGLLRMTVRRLIPPAREADDGSAENDYLPVIMRNLRIALGVLAVILFVDIWDIRIDALMPRSMGPNAASAIFDIAITLILASAFWGVIKTSINRLVPEEDLDLHAIADGESAGTGFSRLQTLLPILRKFVFVTLVVIVGMIVVSSLGVDIGPLLAGAGVVGIAIGFGAQTLVRDIVSGIFFLIDDAFRVGEYIDVGVAKGTVERISIRSLRLRHHLGQINTIPFGEFKHVTNFSRDWVIMKLELRVPLDTDLEKVRKLVKLVGQEMLADPELGPDLLQPLKSQGVNRMEPSAFVLRVKFMTKPGEQFVLRREVFRRLHEVFQENGIRLGVSPTVVDGPPTLAGGGATSAGSEPVVPTSG